jgi:hypothetical protein
MISSWKVCVINDSSWVTTFQKTGSIYYKIQQRDVSKFVMSEFTGSVAKLVK